MHWPLEQEEPKGHPPHCSAPPQPSGSVPHCFVHLFSGVQGGCGSRHDDMSTEQMCPTEQVPQLNRPPLHRGAEGRRRERHKVGQPATTRKRCCARHC
jgi:hypothetical protein